MAKKKQIKEKAKTAKPAAQPKKAAAKAEEVPAKKQTVSKTAAKKPAAAKSKAVTTKKSSAPAPKAVTKTKLTGTMENNEIPAEPNLNAENVSKTDAFQPQAISETQLNELTQRMEKTGQLSDLLSTKFTPMLSNVVKISGQKNIDAAAPTESKTSGDTVTTATSAPMPNDSPSNTFTTTTTTTTTDTSTSNTKSGISLPNIKFNWDKFDASVFDELAKYFGDYKKYKAEHEEKPLPGKQMVVIADFKLPYHCCDDYSCEDMCYTDEELSMLPIPPFAKDDFAVTRKNTSVDIYPDMNDSHLFKDYIVVKEIEDEQSFQTSAGGTVTTDKNGERPHFIYTPPEGKAGLSDSFLYTLYNKANQLSDTATVWIEIAVEMPTFSMNNTMLCNNGDLEPITVDPKGNDWNNLEITGNGNNIVKTTDPNTGVPTWSFDPTKANIGVNTITLKLNGDKVTSIDVTVNEMSLTLDTFGELTDINASAATGTLVLHVHSQNAQAYSWSWTTPFNKRLYTSTDAPDANGNVYLPIDHLPSKAADFVIKVTVEARSEQGCDVIIKGESVSISWSIIHKVPQSVQIVDKYSRLIPPLIDAIDSKIKERIDPKVFIDLKNRLELSIVQVNDAIKLNDIVNGVYDPVIGEIGACLSAMRISDASGMPNDTPYRDTLFDTALVTFALLTIRKDDIDRNNQQQVVAYNSSVETINDLILAGYLPQGVTLIEIENLQLEIDGTRPVMDDGYEKIRAALGI